MGITVVRGLWIDAEAMFTPRRPRRRSPARPAHDGSAQRSSSKKRQVRAPTPHARMVHELSRLLWTDRYTSFRRLQFRQSGQLTKPNRERPTFPHMPRHECAPKATGVLAVGTYMIQYDQSYMYTSSDDTRQTTINTNTIVIIKGPAPGARDPRFTTLTTVRDRVSNTNKQQQQQQGFCC